MATVTMAKRRMKSVIVSRPKPAYDDLLSGISDVLENARRMSARAVNNILTASYWEIGRRIVEFEQHGQERAEYGEALLAQLAADLTARHGRGFSAPSLYRMRGFYLGWEIFSTSLRKFEARVRLAAEEGGQAGQILSTPLRDSEPGAAIRQTSKYLTNLPDKETLRREILKTQSALTARAAEGDKGRPDG